MNFEMLQGLGWKPHFQQQLTEEEEKLHLPARVAAHHGSQIELLGAGQAYSLSSPLFRNFEVEVAVGDWILLDEIGQRPVRILDRLTLLERKAAGNEVRSQPIAANVDTLFIVSSCNQEFNLSRLERYLAVALESGATPVVVLTKADLHSDPAALRQQAERLHTGLIVETLDARNDDEAEGLFDWCRIGQTVALVGSSGVGKSTLAMALGSGFLETGGIREDDAKGRHTTTARSMHRLAAGGLLIDNPGIRELQLAECDQGVADLFEDVVSYFKSCRYRNCRHQGDAGCAVEAAVASGQIDERRVKNYFKLQSEQRRNSESLAERRKRDRQLGKFYKTVQSHNRKNKMD